MQSPKQNRQYQAKGAGKSVVSSSSQFVLDSKDFKFTTQEQGKD
jgi:hypothetical protein